MFSPAPPRPPGPPLTPPLLQLMTLAERSQGVESSSDTGELKNAEEPGRGGVWILITTREEYTGGGVGDGGDGGGGAEYVLTGILIGVQVLASSQSEAEARHAAPGGPGGPQLLAQHQAPGPHGPVAIEDQHAAATLLPAERTADRHVCSGEGTNRGGAWLRHQRQREACRRGGGGGAPGSLPLAKVEVHQRCGRNLPVETQREVVTSSEPLLTRRGTLGLFCSSCRVNSEEEEGEPWRLRRTGCRTGNVAILFPVATGGTAARTPSGPKSVFLIDCRVKRTAWKTADRTTETWLQSFQSCSFSISIKHSES